MRGAFSWGIPPPRSALGSSVWPTSIEVFEKPEGNLLEVLARMNDLDMARAAFAVACEKHPDKFIVLALKAQVLRRSDGALPALKAQILGRSGD